MIDKVKAIYKGDIILANIYLILGFSFALIAVLLYLYTHKIGLYYLTHGLVVFALYSIIKGILLRKVSKNRYRHYNNQNSITINEWQEEFDYTNFRLTKKERNRRRYAWTFAVSCIVAIAGTLMKEKGLIIGTSVPILLFAAIEFSIGLLVEFRLWEFHRQLKKHLGLKPKE